MTVKILVNENRRLNFPAASISTHLNRLTLNKEAFLCLVKEHGSESQYAEILLDDAEDKKGIFYIKFCDGTSAGSRKLDAPSKSSRTFNINNLIQALNLNFTTTTRFKMDYDKVLKAAKVNTNEPIVSSGRGK
jgi:hypothetical protein